MKYKNLVRSLSLKWTNIYQQPSQNCLIKTPDPNTSKTNNYNELNLVLGNESCDLDSAVSALVYATFLHWQYLQLKCKLCTGKYRNESYKDNIFIPILDVERNDYPLKTEVSYCLRHHGINESNLIFRDDINVHQLLSKGKVNVILVDHHILSQRYEVLSPYVIEIIDHRPKQNSTFKDIRSTIEIVGSCCTLICQRIRDLAKLIAKESDFFNMYPITADLMHDVILLDTVNFSKEVNKATPKDEEIILFLEHVLNLENYQQERADKLQQLVSARSDVSLLDASQLLRKDLKILGDIFIPAFPILVKEFLQKPKAIQSVLAALQTSNCSLGLLLGMDLKTGLQRDGAIIGTDEEKGKLLAKFLQEWSKPSLNLVQENEVGCLYFKQLNLGASRKQYIQVLNVFSDNYKK